ncbi:uncharacterized protein LOC120289576 [Eucalyptus grandis]|uniref:uncharacterized protein LOC120289576 n=1 Tax=Eucalyptus grandis TaxID=71139 RepID=UPI00192EBD04|nr:uncharacterized protein LOC120289576 [Eucalyptus grandis]
MASSVHAVEIKLIGANRLENVNQGGGRLLPYAAVWLHYSCIGFTPADPFGGSSPSWNHTVLLPLPSGMPIEDAVLQVRVLHAGSEDGTGLLIGLAQLRLRDVLEDDVGGERAYRWTLQLWEPSSRPQGTVDIELAVREMRYCVTPTVHAVPPPPPPPPPPSSGQEEGIVGVFPAFVFPSSDEDPEAIEDPSNLFSDEASSTSEEASETSSVDKDEDGDTVMIDLACEDDSEDDDDDDDDDN